MWPNSGKATGIALRFIHKRRPSRKAGVAISNEVAVMTWQSNNVVVRVAGGIARRKTTDL